jgi:serine/threonine protein kinase
MKSIVYPPGTVIAGKYRIDKALARGGCSTVYRGVHLDMGRTIALKLLDHKEDEAEDEAWIRRFTREAQLASQLTHPNTITIHDYGHDHEHDGLLYITMEFIDGRSLRDEILERGGLEPRRVANILEKMLESLDEAHRLGILHRDLKPSNIMLGRDHDGCELVKVLDFGLAKSIYAPPEAMTVTQDGDFIGTPRYASPEQLRGTELDQRTDIYGVGMVGWEAIVGTPAVPDIGYGSSVQHHLGEQPWRLPDAIACPPGLADIIHRSLEKDADRRYASCLEMRDALVAWRDSDEPVASADFLSLYEQTDAEEFEHIDDTRELPLEPDVPRPDQLDELFADVVSEVTEESENSGLEDDSDHPAIDLLGEPSSIPEDTSPSLGASSEASGGRAARSEGGDRASGGGGGGDGDGGGDDDGGDDRILGATAPLVEETDRTDRATRSNAYRFIVAGGLLIMLAVLGASIALGWL